ncbi:MULTISPECIES: HvfC/BufC N-terminal domain-containing protein [Streptomyces]|uniref:Putative DNA-binding domain-containing protein n=1 Tax=Streptomyces morookaense TaxID=1970 RepID=A0A7Y7B2P3_STRMO|nr:MULTISPECIES: DNA-binding domain-containing protein [Streptomyces]MCC2276034.1 DNA-binding domain-containing protein [Streptomyces sp. ET3-23]NVK77754.1 putative DNA-binding domain-containing protein [Streptomyces morookaense]
MPDASPLASVQRWMQSVILHPTGEDPGHTITASSRLSARERLLVHQRGYRLRLLECMRSLHPGSVHLLGQEIFDGFALEYLDAHPSRSPLLAGLGAGFAGHLARTRPDAEPGSEPGADREAWIDLLIDLIRCERAFTEVLDGPGPEDGTAPASPLRLLRVCAPVHTYLAAVHRGEDPEPPEPRQTGLALTRRNYMVITRELTPAAYERLHTSSSPRAQEDPR